MAGWTGPALGKEVARRQAVHSKESVRVDEWHETTVFTSSPIAWPQFEPHPSGGARACREAGKHVQVGSVNDSFVILFSNT